MKFKHAKDKNGKVHIYDVPIFVTHDNKGFKCNEDWMDEAVKKHEEAKKTGYLPPVIIGHSKKGDSVEKEAVGFFDNLKRKGKKLYADMVNIRKTYADKIIDGAFPNRSVEVYPKSKRIRALALLGGTTPHFKLPQMYNSDIEETTQWIPYSERGNDMNAEEVGKMLDDRLTIFAENLVKELPGMVHQCYEQQVSGIAGEQQQTGIPPHVNHGAIMNHPEAGAVPTAGQAASPIVIPTKETSEQDMDAMEPSGPQPANQIAEGTEAATEGYSDEELEHLLYEMAEDDNVRATQMKSVVGDLQKRLSTQEHINYALAHKNMKEQYSARLRDIRESGRPIPVDDCLQFALSLEDGEKAELYFRQLEAIPASVPMNSDGSDRGPLAPAEALYSRAQDVKTDFQENEETYRRFGITEDDLLMGSCIRGNEEPG